VAKTALSLSGNPSLKGVPTDFVLPIMDVYLSAGAGFVVVIAGEVIVHIYEKCSLREWRPSSFDDKNNNVISNELNCFFFEFLDIQDAWLVNSSKHLRYRSEHGN